MDPLPRRTVLGMSVTGGLLAAATPGRAQTLPVSPPSGVPDIDAHRGLIEAARSGTPEMAALIERLFPNLASARRKWEAPEKRSGHTAGTATWGSTLSSDTAVVWHRDFLAVTASDRAVAISIDERPATAMRRVPGTDYWFHLGQLRPGTTHNYTFRSDGIDLGYTTVAGYGTDSYPIAGAQRGTLSPMRTVTSRIYGGAMTDYWLYRNAGVDRTRAAPLMIWFDGEDHVGDQDWRGLRLQTVTDNLVHQKRIPPMVHLLIQPGRGGTPQARQFPEQGQDNAMRSLQYDTVSDLFGKHLLDEVIPDVETQVRLRQDGYSRGAAGHSSGGIAAFKIAWFRPDAFSRAMPSNGSFTGLQWHPDQHLDGGYIFSSLIRREARRNIRVWTSEGANDIDVDSEGRPDLYVGGSWPLANIAMAQALKTKLYDFHFRFGNGYHNRAQQALDLPEALSWLWRGYDPSRTSEVFVQEASERRQPIYRLGIVNRET